MIRRPPRSTPLYSSAASDVYKRQHFKNVLAQKIAARKPGADGEYLAWLTLTVMDGMLVQSQLKNPALDTDAFIEATARLITEC